MSGIAVLVAVILVFSFVGYAGNDQPCDNPGCKTKTETAKDAGNSADFTQESTQQNSTNSPNPNKVEEGPCTNPGGQPNCPPRRGLS